MEERRLAYVAYTRAPIPRSERAEFAKATIKATRIDYKQRAFLDFELGHYVDEGVDELEVGMQFHASAPDGQMQIVTIRDLDGDDVTVDGNHPLAGQRLNFKVKVVAVRDASQEEVAHGHVHGEGGHHH